MKNFMQYLSEADQSPFSREMGQRLAPAQAGQHAGQPQQPAISKEQLDSIKLTLEELLKEIGGFYIGPERTPEFVQQFMEELDKRLT